MKREIKFRAWSLRKKEFINDEFLLTDSVGRVMKIVGVTYKNNPDDMDDEVELSQFTGLHDENGEEVYEGDIVNTVCGSFIIEWNDDCCKWQYSNGMDINDGEMYGMSKWVVGNIYENHELIK
jgi:hypothetical protein